LFLAKAQGWQKPCAIYYFTYQSI